MTIFPQQLVRLKPSKMLIGEVGLFAVRFLKKGTVINKSFCCNEKFFSKDVLDKLDNITKNMVTDFSTRTRDGFFSVPNMNYLPISWFGNHSCDPNMGFNDSGDLIMIRSVKTGEELTHDYGFSITDPEYKMNCHCGSKKCRKIITGDDWRDSIYFEKNKKYMNI